MSLRYIKELNVLNESVRTVYQKAIENFKDVSFKEGDEIVTSTDLFIESNLIKAILKAFPNDTFLSEEFFKHGDLKDRTWIIDPIDGTSNYAVSLNMYVVQIALYDEGDLVLSYIYYPVEDKVYHAIKGEGSYVNGVKYHILDNHKPSNKLLSMVGYTNKHSKKEIYRKLLDYAVLKQLKLRMLGSIGLELAIMSEGKFVCFYSNIKNLWDLAPGVLLNRESGAILLNERFEPYQIGDAHLFVFKSTMIEKEIFEALQ